MILPLNLHPEINAYMHHAAVNAIIDSPELLRLKVIDDSDERWRQIIDNVNVKMDNHEVTVTDIASNKGEKGFAISRKCAVVDNLAVIIDFVKEFQRGAYISLFIGPAEDAGKMTETNYVVCIHQYGVSVFCKSNLKKYTAINFSESRQFKIVREDMCCACYISSNGSEWDEIDKSILQFNEQTHLIGISSSLLANSEYKDWLMMNYIQLYLNEKDSVGKVFLDYRMNPVKNYHYEYKYADQFLDIVYERLGEVLAFHSDFVEFIKKSLAYRYYISVSMDEYYVAKRKSYQKNHFFHHNLIYGYDENKDVFLVLGYSDKLMPGLVSAEDLAQMDLDIEGSIIRYKRDYCSNKCHFNISNLLFQLENFYYGKSAEYYQGNTLADQEGVFGIKALEIFRDTESGRKLLMKDSRVSYLIYEHASLMKKRIEFLKCIPSKHRVVTDEMNDEAEALLEATILLKNQVIKNRLKGGLEEKIRSAMAEICRLERSLVYKMILNIKETV